NNNRMPRPPNPQSGLQQQVVRPPRPQQDTSLWCQFNHDGKAQDGEFSNWCYYFFNGLEGATPRVRSGNFSQIPRRKMRFLKSSTTCHLVTKLDLKDSGSVKKSNIKNDVF